MDDGETIIRALDREIKWRSWKIKLIIENAVSIDEGERSWVGDWSLKEGQKYSTANATSIDQNNWCSHRRGFDIIV